MRRSDRAVLNYDEMLRIMESCNCCRLGFRDGDHVYIVPLNFGYAEIQGKLILYFHGANTGKKIDLLKTQPIVGFEMDTKHELVEHETACGYSYLYQSIIGEGEGTLAHEVLEKRFALQCIMSHYTGKSDWNFKEEVVNKTAIIKLTITRWSCKAHNASLWAPTEKAAGSNACAP